MNSNQLKEFRVGVLKVTQKELAIKLGLASNTVSRMESGDMPVKNQTFLALQYLAYVLNNSDLEPKQSQYFHNGIVYAESITMNEDFKKNISIKRLEKAMKMDYGHFDGYVNELIRNTITTLSSLNADDDAVSDLVDHGLYALEGRYRPQFFSDADAIRLYLTTRLKNKIDRARVSDRIKVINESESIKTLKAEFTSGCMTDFHDHIPIGVHILSELDADDEAIRDIVSHAISIKDRRGLFFFGDRFKLKLFLITRLKRGSYYGGSKELGQSTC